MAKKKLRDAIHLVAYPIGIDDLADFDGTTILVGLTRQHAEWILAMRQALTPFITPTSSFYRAWWFTDQTWLSEIGDDKVAAKMEDDVWLELPASWRPLADDDPREVRSELWTIGIGDTDVLWQFHEKHNRVGRESPTLSFDTIRDMLPRLK